MRKTMAAERRKTYADSTKNHYCHPANRRIVVR